jgi:hypothetical protein
MPYTKANAIGERVLSVGTAVESVKDPRCKGQNQNPRDGVTKDLLLNDRGRPSYRIETWLYDFKMTAIYQHHRTSTTSRIADPPSGKQ